MARVAGITVEKLLSIKSEMKRGVRKEVDMSNFWED